jgi:hypothetical protein
VQQIGIENRMIAQFSLHKTLREKDIIKQPFNTQFTLNGMIENQEVD